MSIFTYQNVGFNITPQPPIGTQVAVNLSPLALQYFGLNIPVELSTASHYRGPPLNMPLHSIVVMAHFDTGASLTSIDINLAKYLNLIATGNSQVRTASGNETVSTFAIDIGFPNSGLSSFRNLPISSCNLGFDLGKNQKDLNDPRNFGLLIGRDIMSRWNIVWNGTSSTVIISD